ncbi:MAG TPA: tetratricopeptide repeat protein [Acetobacteraceae bacterium]|nr:tetratricopeptide repeat protein [Acetobacteraceae bacterium]
MNREQRRAQAKTAPTPSASSPINTNPIQQLFDRALQYHTNGRLAEAEALYRRILATDSCHADALHLLGVIGHQVGRNDAAVALIGKAIDIDGSVAAYHSNRGNALKDLGRLQEAVASYDAALRIRPDFADALYNRGNVLKDLGHLDDALTSYDAALRIRPHFAEALANRSIALHGLGRLPDALASCNAALRIRPNFVEALSNRGSILKDLGRLDDALVSYDAALRIKPDYIEALSNRGLTLHGLGRLDDAVASYDAALRIKPTFAEALSNRANALNGLDRLDDAIASYDAALRIRPDYAEALYNRANTFNDLGRLDEAIASYDAALCIRPGYVEVLSNRGNVLNSLGRLDEAIASYDSALRIKPHFAEAHRNLSLAKTYVAGDPHLMAMETIYRNPAISDGERSNICFALGKAYEDLGCYSDSFHRYAEGNALRKRMLAYSIDQDRVLFSALCDLFAQARPRQPTPSAPPYMKRPIFIVGMPRSGTTLAEQILASHSQVYGAGEMQAMNNAIRAEANPDGQEYRFSLADDALAGIRHRYLAALDGLRTAKPVVTDKMPLNFRWLGFVLETIPEARVVNLVRDPVAVCWSIFKHYFPATGLGFAYDLVDLADYYRIYQNLMAFWHERYPGRIFDLDYQRLTEDQEGQTRALLDYCGLAWESNCLDFHRTERAVRTASATQVRRQMYRGSSDAWKKFENHLQPLIEALSACGCTFSSSPGLTRP